MSEKVEMPREMMDLVLATRLVFLYLHRPDFSNNIEQEVLILNI